MQHKQTHIAVLAAILLAGTMITSASATYQFGSNPVLMLKNAQAQQAEGCLPEEGAVCFGGDGEILETTISENGTVQEEPQVEAPESVGAGDNTTFGSQECPPICGNESVTEEPIAELPVEQSVDEQVEGFVSHAEGDIDQAITVLEGAGIEAVGDVNLTIIEEAAPEPVANETGNVTEPTPEPVPPVENETVVEEPVANETVTEEPIAEEEIPSGEVCGCPSGEEEEPIVIEVPGNVTEEEVVEGNVTDPIVVIPENETITIPENTTEVIEVVDNQTDVIEDATENVTSTDDAGTEDVLTAEVQTGLLVLFQVQAERADFDQLSTEQQDAIEGAIDSLSGAIDTAVDVLAEAE
jgi:hypothetical protein